MNFSNVISASSFLVAAISFLVAARTYQRQNVAKRFEIFQAFNKRFDREFAVLRNLLDEDNPQLEHHDRTEKHNLLAFFEEIAISVKSDIMSFDVAFYFFGPYITRSYSSRYFKKGKNMLDIKSPYWNLYRQFASEMIQTEKRLGRDGIYPDRLTF